MNIAEKLREVVEHICYTKEEVGENPSYEDRPKDCVLVEGLVNNFIFHPGRLEEKRGDIKELLEMMPPEFFKETGGGMSFLKLPFDKNGNQWGEQPTAELLVAAGIAAGYVSYCLPREMWAMMPGGVPYIVIDLTGQTKTPESKEEGIKRMVETGRAAQAKERHTLERYVEMISDDFQSTFTVLGPNKLSNMLGLEGDFEKLQNIVEKYIPGCGDLKFTKTNEMGEKEAYDIYIIELETKQ